MNAIDGAAFNPKDPHHEDAFNKLCESMAVVGTRRLLQNAIDRTDASGVQLAMRPDIKGFIAAAIYNGLKNDPAFAVRNMAEKMVDDPDYMREKCLSYVDEYDKARKRSMDARKKQKNAVKDDATKKKQEQKKVKDDSVLKPRVAGR